MTIIRLLRIFAVLRNTGIFNTFIKGFNPILKTFNSKNNVEQNFRKTLESLGPVFIKLGQLLSTRTDIISKELAAELNNLTDNCEPIEYNYIKDQLISNLGDNAKDILEDIDPKPLASASLAQVHRFTKDGENFVVKVQKPNLDEQIEVDIKAIRLGTKILRTFYKGYPRVDLNSVVDDYEKIIMNELDFRIEAANAKKTYQNFTDNNYLYVPKILDKYTTKKILVMEYIDGIPITNIANLKKHNLNLKVLSENGVRIFLKQVFQDNFFHADMHPGNIFVSAENPDEPTYVAVDYAICGSLSEKEQLLIGKMLADMFSRNYSGVAKTMIGAGWVSSSTKPIELEVTIRTAIDPIFEKPFSEINFGEMLLFLFEETRAYELSLPASLLLLHKTLINIEGLGRQIYPDLDLWTTAKPFIQNWISNRYNPKNIMEQLKNNTGDFAEKAYELPDKLESIFNNLANLDEFNDEIKSLRRDISKQKQNSRFFFISSTAAIIVIISTIIFL